MYNLTAQKKGFHTREACSQRVSDPVDRIVGEQDCTRLIVSLRLRTFSNQNRILDGHTAADSGRRR
jgi:hypothetical protein